MSDLDAAVALYERLLGARCERRAVDRDQGVEAAAMRVGGDCVELVAALDGDTPVGRFLARRGQGVHHVAYAVDDLAKAIGEAREAGADVIEPAPRPGLFGTEVAFIHPASVDGVLVELVQTTDGA